MRALLFGLLLLSAAPALAQDWTTSSKILVTPGRSAGVLVLGKPVPPSASTLYGAPNLKNPSIPGATGKDTGSMVFGKAAEFELIKGLLVKLNDGRGDENVYAIYARGVRAYTPEGVTMGMTRQKAKAIYPQAAAETDGLTGHPMLKIPGLDMLFVKDRLIELVIRSK